MPNWYIHNKWTEKAGIDPLIANFVNTNLDYGTEWAFSKNDQASEDVDEPISLRQLKFFYKKDIEKNLDGEALIPVVCASCGTLYHKTCWEQSGGKCAILGCGHDKFHVYGRDLGPALKLNYDDIPQPSANGRGPDGSSRRQRRLKEEQKRQVEAMRRPGLLQRFFQWLLDQIRVG